MIRRFAVLLSLAAALAIPSVAHATTVTLNDYVGPNPDFVTNAPGGGGAFRATTAGVGNLGVASFITFCLEFNEHFSPGGTYNYDLSTEAKNGGVGGPHPDPVSDATKWLYYEVVTGGYTGIAAFHTEAANVANVGARVQEAIWLIEEERLLTDLTDPYSAALATYAQGLGAFSPVGFTVYAMNLTNISDNSPAQDQLAMTGPGVGTTDFGAVPEPATLVLLGTGLLFTSRHLFRKKTRP